MTLFALPTLITLLIISSVLLLFKRWKLSAFIMMIAIAFNCYWQVCPFHFQISKTTESSNSFRIITYNIYPQVDSTKYDEWQRQVFTEIKLLRPDILCLQEFNGNKMPWLESQLCKYFGYTEETIKERRHIKYRLYSRYPMSNISRYKPVEDIDTTDLDSNFIKSLHNHTTRQPYYSADIHLPNGSIVTVFSCHLMSNGYSRIRRSMKDCENWFDGIERYTRATHSAEKIRLWEAKNLRHVIDSIGNCHPIVVAGDFNDFNRSKSLNIIQGKALNDAWWRSGNGLGFTYSGFHLHLRLDHILYNSNINLEQIKVGNSDLSDHRPLIADFSIEN